MKNYFEQITQGNADQIISALVERFPDLATVKINFWEKDGSVKRFYFNGMDGDVKKTFNLNIKERIIFVNDYEEAYWNDLLGLDSIETFKKELHTIVDEVISYTY